MVSFAKTPSHSADDGHALATSKERQKTIDKGWRSGGKPPEPHLDSGRNEMELKVGWRSRTAGRPYRGDPIGPDPTGRSDDVP
jgi:hypothetical protein